MIEIIPAILAESKDEFEKKLRLVEHHVDTVQVDILDGTSFPFTNWHDAEAVSAMATPIQYELHLMVENPIPIAEEWKKFVPSVKRVIFHAEIDRPLGAMIEHLHQVVGVEVGIALNPETPLDEIRHVLPDIDYLLVMGVHPGASGQPFEGDYILEKIRTARARRPDLPIGIDGGVTAELIPALISAGATRICLASAIFNTEDPVTTLTSLKKHSTIN